MNLSTRKFLIALVAMLLCVGLWYKRISDADNSVAQSPAKIDRASEAEPMESIEPATSVDGVASVLTTINWADPQNPVAIPLSLRGTTFLFETQNGLQFWDSNSLKMTPMLLPVDNAKLLENIWMRVHHANLNGTLIAVSSGQSPSPTTLMLLSDNNFIIESRFDLPADFVPSALVALSPDRALICSSTMKQAKVFSVVYGKLTQVTAAMSFRDTQTLLQNAGVTGDVEGFGNLKALGPEGSYTTKQPLVFNTSTCKWSARNLPEPLASGRSLQLMPKYLVSHRSHAIVAASWRDPATNELRTLSAPLIWSSGDGQWRARQTSDLPGMHPNRLTGVTGEQWTYAASASQGRFSFLASVDDQWRESTQRLPATEDLKLLPIGNEGVLALLIDSKKPGRVVRLDPGKEWRTRVQFPHRLTYENGVIPLANGELMVITGSNSSYVMLVSPKDPTVISLPNLPQPMIRPSGVQMLDGSVVVFGGLHPACFVTSLKDCAYGSQPSFRWIPTEKRWQPLPTLAIPFAFGEFFDVSNSGITSRDKRIDFQISQGDELFYLSGNVKNRSNNQLAGPSRLYRWKGVTTALAMTRVNRHSATLVELNDGRFAVVGGSSENEPASAACQQCQKIRKEAVAAMAEKLAQNRNESMDEAGEDGLDPETAIPHCEPCSAHSTGDTSDSFKFARSSELYDRRSDRWNFGPFSNFAGGRAVKLANGRIFKFGLQGYSSTDNIYAAETADAGLTQWVATPPFPFDKPASVSEILAVGNQVLVVMAKPEDRYVIWDDTTRRWQIHPLPKPSNWTLRTTPWHVSKGGANQVLMIYQDTFEYLAWPLQQSL